LRKVPPWLAPVAVSLALIAFILDTLLLSGGDERLAGVAIATWLLITGGTGALITVRKPGHAVGSLLVLIVVVVTTHGVVQNYATAGLERGASLPGEMIAAWLTTWIGSPAIAFFIILILVFPTGTFLSRTWRRVGAVTAGAVGIGMTAAALMPGPLPAIPDVKNPLGIEGLEGALRLVNDTVMVIPAVGLLAAVVSQVVRLRRAQGQQRQQIKLVAYAIVIVPLLIVISQFVIPQGTSEGQWVEFVINIGAALLIPIAIGVAILRHQLFDIDVVINRTLVYGMLTAVLAGAYASSVFALQLVLAPIMDASDLAVAASTLAVAALFRPARTRVQMFIDRRFYRRKFDAQQTLDDFSDHLRDEVELRSLSSKLVTVVADTMQPAHVSLWLKEAR